MQIDAQTYEVRADGQLLTCDPATRAADGAAVLPVLRSRRDELSVHQCSTVRPGRSPRAAAAAPCSSARATVELTGTCASKSRFEATDSAAAGWASSCRAARWCAAATCWWPRTARWCACTPRRSRCWWCATAREHGTPERPAARRLPPGQPARGGGAEARPPEIRARPRAGRDAAAPAPDRRARSWRAVRARRRCLCGTRRRRTRMTGTATATARHAHAQARRRAPPRGKPLNVPSRRPRTHVHGPGCGTHDHDH